VTELIAKPGMGFRPPEIPYMSGEEILIDLTLVIQILHEILSSELLIIPD
jgi:hypothetical protein